MGRVGTVVKGETGDETKQWNPLVTDYVSQTDTTKQNMASDLEFASGKKPIYDGQPTGTHIRVNVTGVSPITYAHGQGSEPDNVTLGINASQPYTASYTKDATNIKIYHNAAGSLTISIDAYWS